ncbi:hypothetical protein Mapa_016859 [Marchantia paleacea]|nr:hypothetical protein Mapa_016859 [Marchantia paleacea]
METLYWQGSAGGGISVIANVSRLKYALNNRKMETLYFSKCTQTHRERQRDRQRVTVACRSGLGAGTVQEHQCLCMHKALRACAAGGIEQGGKHTGEWLTKSTIAIWHCPRGAIPYGAR